MFCCFASSNLTFKWIYLSSGLLFEWTKTFKDVTSGCWCTQIFIFFKITVTQSGVSCVHVQTPEQGCGQQKKILVNWNSTCSDGEKNLHNIYRLTKNEQLRLWCSGPSLFHMCKFLLHVLPRHHPSAFLNQTVYLNEVRAHLHLHMWKDNPGPDSLHIEFIWETASCL